MRRILAFVRDKFFSTWDRGLTTVSFLATIAGTLITIFLVKYPGQVPTYIAVRDYFFWFSLILLSLVVVSIYVRRESVIRNQINLLSDQFKLAHDLVHSYRTELFSRYFQPDIRRHKLTDKEEKIFRHLCSYITEGVKTSFLAYFESKGIDIGDDAAVSVKLLISPEEVFERFKLSPEQRQQFQSNDQWIITVYRDHHTHMHVSTREKNLKIYNIEKNTDLRHVVMFKEPFYVHNNLQSLGNNYENENPGWREHYNATLVVPIRYLSNDNQQYRCYGVLAVDSLNKKKINDLYNDNECRYILGHAADLLATFFLLLEFIEYLPKQVDLIVKSEPTTH